MQEIYTTGIKLLYFIFFCQNQVLNHILRLIYLSLIKIPVEAYIYVKRPGVINRWQSIIGNPIDNNRWPLVICYGLLSGIDDQSIITSFSPLSAINCHWLPSVIIDYCLLSSRLFSINNWEFCSARGRIHVCWLAAAFPQITREIYVKLFWLSTRL